MSNIDRAAEVIERTKWEHRAKILRDGGTLKDATAEEFARALADTRLLRPDLPKPIINDDDGNPEWHADEYTVDVDRGLVGLWTPDGTHWEQTPNRARLLADALYAATDHAEARRVEQLGSEIAAWSTELNRRLEGDTDH